ncbi:MAG: DUF3800 domain-containing protein [Phycisphaerales bacterium]|nr:DUF3800 domain-containing protein [Phycisphaerales bacterium]
MLVFFDESGDPGMRFSEGSSLLFTAAAVVFDDHHASTNCQRHIEAMRDAMRIREFHFADLSHRKRLAFFDGIRSFPFGYYAFVLNKQKLWSRKFSAKKSVYEYPLDFMFSNMAPVLDDAQVILDRCGDRQFRRDIKARLLKHKGVRTVIAERSHNNALVQLADMVCGAVARSFGSRKKPDEYRNLIRHRERQVRFWPQ